MSGFKDRFPLPFRTVLWFSVLVSFILQLAIISYNHLTGFSTIESITEFTIGILYGTVLTTFVALLMVYADLVIIRYMNRWFSWEQKYRTRVPVQLFIVSFLAALLAMVLTAISNLITPYEQDLAGILIANILIAMVVNLILVIILEAWLFFRERKRLELKREALEKELTQIRFDVLKSQMNPHFLFNSLNVLSGLISKDAGKAEQFIDEFSMVYRYVLETIEKPVVLVEEELEFVRSYMYLQKIRYGDQLEMEVSLESDTLKMLLPPLSLQVVLENVIKHNRVDTEDGLKILIFEEEKWLIVKNRIRLKMSSNRSTGVGQKNLIKRYAMISELEPKFLIDNDHYIVKMPLLDRE